LLRSGDRFLQIQRRRGIAITSGDLINLAFIPAPLVAILGKRSLEVKTGVLVIEPAVFVRLVIGARVDDLAEKSYLLDRTENVKGTRRKCFPSPRTRRSVGSFGDGSK
jgi:hypothetical protein